jgi:hypothetical protein
LAVVTGAGAGAGVGAGVGVDGAVGVEVPFEHAALATMATQIRVSIPRVMVPIDILSPSHTHRIDGGFNCDSSK